MRYYIYLHNHYIPLEKNKNLYCYEDVWYENYKLKDDNPILLKRNNIYIINITYHGMIYYTNHWWDKYLKKYIFLQSENLF